MTKKDVYLNNNKLYQISFLFYMPRVLIVGTSKYTRGGITAAIKAQQQGEQWKQFHCKWIGYHVDRANWIKIMYYLLAMLRYILNVPFYQIVHFQFSLPTDARRSYYFFKIAKLFRKKTIVHLHCGDQLQEIWSPMYDELFTQSDIALVLSPSIKRKVEEYIGTNHRVEVLYNPCPTILSVTPFEKRKNEILFAGTLNANKGYADLITGFSKIAKKHPDWKVVFAGNGQVEQAKVIAKKFGVKDQCQFLGWVNGEQKDAAFRRASILCLASYQEGFPMAVLDAWAYGVPIVTTPAGGLIDIINEEKNGLLFEAGNCDQLAVKLENIISNSTLREHIARESKMMSKTTFNINNLNKKLGEIYRRLL